jgi:MEMO1 family protein
MTAISNVRPSPIAGRWYEGDPKRLAAIIDNYLSAAKLPPLEGDVVGVIAPHAGHIYSGDTAGYAFAAVKGRSYPLVGILSPLHNFHPSPLLTTSHSAYRTPLGDMEVDTGVLSSLEEGLGKQGILLSRIANDQEHSLEIELPFLQRALVGRFKLLPLMVRSEDPDFLRKVGECLADALEGRIALLVASTDLSHFHTEEYAEELDTEMLSQIGDFSPEGVLFAERSGSGSACGSGAVAAVLWAAKKMGAGNVLVLHHSTSGKTTGDHDSVVGYGAAVILKDSIDPNP